MTLQQHILNIAHSSHQGETKTKAILREKVWWIGMSSAVENLVKTCYSCQVVAQPQNVLSDYRSRYPLLTKLREISSTTIINAFKRIFAISVFLKRLQPT